MAAARRLLASGLASVLALALTTAPAYAATRRTPTAKPTPAAQVRKAPTILPPQIYQLTPLKVNPTVQPNIMILGQYMTRSEEHTSELQSRLHLVCRLLL